MGETGLERSVATRHGHRHHRRPLQEEQLSAISGPGRQTPAIARHLCLDARVDQGAHVHFRAPALVRDIGNPSAVRGEPRPELGRGCRQPRRRLPCLHGQRPDVEAIPGLYRLEDERSAVRRQIHTAHLRGVTKQDLLVAAAVRRDRSQFACLGVEDALPVWRPRRRGDVALEREPARYVTLDVVNPARVVGSADNGQE